MGPLVVNSSVTSSNADLSLSAYLNSTQPSSTQPYCPKKQGFFVVQSKTKNPFYVAGELVEHHPIVRLISRIGSFIATSFLPNAQVSPRKPPTSEVPMYIQKEIMGRPASIPEMLMYMQEEMGRAASPGDIVMYVQGKMMQKNMASFEENQKIAKTYGKYFCDIIGVDTIRNLTKVEASQLQLANDHKDKYPTICPSDLGTHSAVRGMMGSGKPFIAIKIEVLDPKTEAVIAVAELICERLTELSKDFYVTLDIRQVVSLEAGDFPSYLRFLSPFSGPMTEQHIKAVRDLLEGKTIKTLMISETLLNRMAK